MRKALVGTALFILAFVSPAHSDPSENQTRSLVGLREISVVVEPLRDEVVRDGLTTKDIRTSVELRLRESGVTVVPESGAVTFLYINVNAQKRPDMLLYAVNIDVSLRQNVALLRDPTIQVFFVPTWRRSYIYSGGGASLSEGARNSLRALLDEFLNDYLAANPKR
jgi:hypothetical protein